VWVAPSTTLTLWSLSRNWVLIFKVLLEACLQAHVLSVKFAAILVHTWRTLSSTVINSHQEPLSGQACNPLDPHWFFLSYSQWRSFTVLGSKLAPFPYLIWGLAFTACVVFSFFFFQRSEVLVGIAPCVLFGTAQFVCFQLVLYIRECTKPRCNCPSSSAVFLISVFSRKAVEVCVCITVWSWRLKVHVMTKVV